MKRILCIVLLIASTALVRPSLASSDKASPVYTLYTLEALVKKADNIMIGRVASVNEKMEYLSLNKVISLFLVLTVQFEDVEVLRGDKEKTVIRQYSSIANTWKTGETLMVFSLKPTSLGFDTVLGAGILRVNGSDAKGLILYKDVMHRTMPLHEILQLIKAREKR